MYNIIREYFMKKNTMGLLFLLILNIGFAYTQEQEQEKDKRYSVQINPIALIATTIKSEFQYKIDNYWNLSIRPNIAINRSIFLGSGSGYDDNGNSISVSSYYNGIILSFMPGIMFRPFGKGLRGMYIGLHPNIGWQNINKISNYYIVFKNVNEIHHDNDSIKINDNFFVFGIGAEVGYEWIFKKGFTITLGGGFGKNWAIASKENSGYVETKSDNSILGLLILTVSIGYSF
jgi:hypothetical protein